MDHIVRHVAKGDKVKDVVRWYGYTPADDMVELPAHTSEQLIARYW